MPGERVGIGEQVDAFGSAVLRGTRLVIVRFDVVWRASAAVLLLGAAAAMVHWAVFAICSTVHANPSYKAWEPRPPWEYPLLFAASPLWLAPCMLAAFVATSAVRKALDLQAGQLRDEGAAWFRLGLWLWAGVSIWMFVPYGIKELDGGWYADHIYPWAAIACGAVAGGFIGVTGKGWPPLPPRDRSRVPLVMRGVAGVLVGALLGAHVPGLYMLRDDATGREAVQVVAAIGGCCVAVVVVGATACIYRHGLLVRGQPFARPRTEE